VTTALGTTSLANSQHKNRKQKSEKENFAFNSLSKKNFCDSSKPLMDDCFFPKYT